MVNDLGVDAHGASTADDPAEEVAETIRAAGGDAVVNHDDIADWAGAERLVRSAVAAFGRLDILVNNAGFLRDRMVVNMSLEEWDAVVRVHLNGAFVPTRWAASYWRDLAKRGEIPDARVINTTSGSGLYGNIGQANYAAGKAGVAAFTVVAAQELGRYGITVNAIAPGAKTRMTEGLPALPGVADEDASGFDSGDPDNVSPVVAWLASDGAAHVTGRVFNVYGGRLSIADGWRGGREVNNRERWQAADVGPVIDELMGEAAPRVGPTGQVMHRPRG